LSFLERLQLCAHLRANCRGGALVLGLGMGDDAGNGGAVDVSVLPECCNERAVRAGERDRPFGIRHNGRPDRRGDDARRRDVMTDSDKWLIVAGATWVMLAVVGFVMPAHADDCARYIQSAGSNLAYIPQAVFEDCMRTGYAQAIITGVVGVVGGGL